MALHQVLYYKMASFYLERSAIKNKSLQNENKHVQYVTALLITATIVKDAEQFLL